MKASSFTTGEISTLEKAVVEFMNFSFIKFPIKAIMRARSCAFYIIFDISGFLDVEPVTLSFHS